MVIEAALSSLVKQLEIVKLGAFTLIQKHMSQRESMSDQVEFPCEEVGQGALDVSFVESESAGRSDIVIELRSDGFCETGGL